MLKYAIVIDETTKKCDIGLGTDAAYYESIGMTLQDVAQDWRGQWYLTGFVPQKPAPTHEEQKEARAGAYQAEVDPITCHILRLQTEPESDENKAKIQELTEERTAKVAEIKAEYPYPEATA